MYKIVYTTYSIVDRWWKNSIDWNWTRRYWTNVSFEKLTNERYDNLSESIIWKTCSIEFGSRINLTVLFSIAGQMCWEIQRIITSFIEEMEPFHDLIVKSSLRIYCEYHPMITDRVDNEDKLVGITH